MIAVAYFKQATTGQVRDYRLRDYLKKQLANAGLVRVDIERSHTAVKVIIHVSRPGVVIGKGGTNLEVIKKGIEQVLNVSKVKKDKAKIDLRVEEVKDADLSAKLVAERIEQQLIKRFPPRRAVSRQ